MVVYTVSVEIDHSQDRYQIHLPSKRHFDRLWCFQNRFRKWSMNVEVGTYLVVKYQVTFALLGLSALFHLSLVHYMYLPTLPRTHTSTFTTFYRPLQRNYLSHPSTHPHTHPHALSFLRSPTSPSTVSTAMRRTGRDWSTRRTL